MGNFVGIKDVKLNLFRREEKKKTDFYDGNSMGLSKQKLIERCFSLCLNALTTLSIAELALPIKFNCSLLISNSSLIG